MPLGAVLAGLGAAFGSAINASSQRSINNQNIRFQKELYERQYKDALEFWGMQNAYNSPQEQIKRFQEAGLNPALMYSRGSSGEASSIPVPDSAPPQLRSPQWGDAFNEALGGLSQFYDMSVKNAQLNNLETQNTVLEQEVIGRKIDNARKEFDLNQELSLADVSVDYRKEQVRALREGTNVNLERSAREAVMQSYSIEESAARFLNLYEERQRIAADTARSEAQRLQILEETRRTKENIKLLKQQGTLNKLEIELRRKNMSWNDPLVARYIAGIYDRATKVDFDSLKKHFSQSPVSWFSFWQGKKK